MATTPEPTTSQDTPTGGTPVLAEGDAKGAPDKEGEPSSHNTCGVDPAAEIAATHQG